MFEAGVLVICLRSWELWTSMVNYYWGDYPSYAARSVFVYALSESLLNVLLMAVSIIALRRLKRENSEPVTVSYSDSVDLQPQNAEGSV